MTDKYILVIDEGTTGTRALIVDQNSHIKAQAYTEFTQFNPAPDRVEHDAEEIWQATVAMMKKALAEFGWLQIKSPRLASPTSAPPLFFGIEKPASLFTALVWQDTRTAGYIETIRGQWAEKAYAHTGWALAPVYSSLNLWWLLENVPGARQKAQAGELAFGTIDSWLIHKLTGGKVHVIAASNASVTGSYDLVKNEWYKEWLDFLKLPLSMFPPLVDDFPGIIANCDASLLGVEIPITGVIADQHAALFSQGCVEPGTVKCTHGTGTFLDMNIGPKLARLA